jgi:hypothetical protein
MPPFAGDKPGPYKILAQIGAGGSQVYRARHTSLGREVAIKLSSEHFAERFEREAHNGRLWAASGGDPGAILRFTLPVPTGAAPSG